MARLDIDERMVRLEEAEIALPAGVTAAALDKAGLPEEWRLVVGAALTAELWAVAV
jgi:hypothetical protein